MPITLLATKFYCPPARETLVARPRLVECLSNGLRGSLVLISAPAGYGKTTLLSEWRASQGLNVPLAWITLDQNDNDPTCFLTYFVSALRAVSTTLGEASLAALQSPRRPLTETILTSLINDLNALDHHFVLVLDDYHLIEARSVHDALTFLLDHLPPCMHLIILTRADPPILLSRLRARGQLTEIRTADLRFTIEETETFLNQVMKLGLSKKHIIELERSTEGWIAGLQLAALSLQGREDAQSFVSGFTGSHHFIADYLVEEVLNRQPEALKDFLLNTSILDRMTGPLCDAVTNSRDGQDVLEKLEHGNLFVIPLDDGQHWYRYHRLFAELLQNRLRRESPGKISELHQRSSRWCFLNGLIPEAIKYAIAGGDFEQAALLIEEGIPPMQKRGEFGAISGWLSKLPEEVIRTRPRLCISYAWVIAFSSGAPDRVERYLKYADNVVNDLPSSAVTRDLLGQIACIRANVAVYLGDNPRAIELCAQAQNLLSEGNTALRSYTALMLADASWMMGDGITSRHALEEAIQLSHVTGDLQTALLSMNYLARVLIAHGLLRQAQGVYQEAIDLATNLSGLRWPATGIIYVGLGMLLWEQNDVESAINYLTDGVELATQSDDIDSLLFGYTTLARIDQARGNTQQAIEMIGKAERIVHETKLARDRYRLASRQTRLMLAKNDIQGAIRWSKELTDCVEEYSRSSLLPDISPLRIAERITQARVLIAQKEADPAYRLITPLLVPLEAAGRMRSVVEILSLQAISLQAQGKQAQAMTALSRALTIAEPEGFIRLFVDEGYPMANLIRRMKLEDRGSKGYVEKLLAAFEPIQPARVSFKLPSIKHERESTVEALSARELEVLRLIAIGRSNREIATELTLAIGTVKRHTANIFDKLNVRNRTEAVAAARDLGLL